MPIVETREEGALRTQRIEVANVPGILPRGTVYLTRGPVGKGLRQNDGAAWWEVNAWESGQAPSEDPRYHGFYTGVGAKDDAVRDFLTWLAYAPR